MRPSKHFGLSTFTTTVIIGFSLLHPCFNSQGESETPTTSRFTVLTRGKLMYHAVCSPCHGSDGAGNGPVAFNLKTKPRDLTKGVFKNRSTSSGQLPTDYDLYRNITSGFHNTAMPAFQYMSPKDRWAVVQYIKTFSKQFSDSTNYPLQVVAIGQPLTPSPASLEKGRESYIKMGCWHCHGTSGQGDGPSAEDLFDDFGDPLRATDLTNPSEYKFGRSVVDLYRIFSTGLNGTPMPSYADAMNEEERWHLANYVWSLQNKDQYQDGNELEDIEGK